MTKNTSAARFWSLSPLGPAASSPVGLESLGPSPPRPAAQGTDGEGTRPYKAGSSGVSSHPCRPGPPTRRPRRRAPREGTRPTGRARGVFPVHPIGVGMVVAGHPSLRTGLADFPHPALHPSPPRLAAQGTDGETPSLPTCRYRPSRPLGPAASSPVGLESLGPSPLRLAAQGADGETPSLPNCQTAMPRAGRQRGNQRRGEGRTAQQSRKQQKTAERRFRKKQQRALG